jgi:hypothetical protein
MIQAHIALCDIPETTTIFAFAVSILQTHTITPLDPKPDTVVQPIKSQLRLPLVSSGIVPESHRVYPDITYPALWRGVAAGGKDDRVLILDLQDRVLQDDGIVRPSTLPG